MHDYKYANVKLVCPPDICDNYVGNKRQCFFKNVWKLRIFLIPKFCLVPKPVFFFGRSIGVWILWADVSEYPVSSTFKVAVSTTTQLYHLTLPMKMKQSVPKCQAHEVQKPEDHSKERTLHIHIFSSKFLHKIKYIIFTFFTNFVSNL
jgi:hypothetical protein